MAPLARTIALASAITMASAVPKPQSFERAGLIVGGEAAAAGDFPYIVSLQSGSHFCGGSLLNANTVLTAAHCSTSTAPSSVSIRAGSLDSTAGGVTANVAEIIIHPGYVASTFENDIAIWKLASPVAEGGAVGFASLPAAGFDPADGAILTVAGWGAISEGGPGSDTALQKVTIPVVDRDTCNAAYGGSITDVMFCAGVSEGGLDSCQRDSGGPIRDDATGVVVGVVSWGTGCAVRTNPLPPSDTPDLC